MQHSSRLLSLPLAKYSRAADVARGDADQYAWSHVSHDLTLVFDTLRGTNSQMLWVLHGGQALESIPIQDLIAQSNDVIRTMMQLRVTVRNEQLPISALTRRPLFALRWNQSNDRLRRVQLKFVSDADFERCCSHVRALGLRISTSEQRPATASPTSAATSPETARGAPSFLATKLADMNQRPSTAAAISSSYVNRTMPKVSSPLARHSITASPDKDEPAPPARPASSAASYMPQTSPPDQFGAQYPRSNPLEPPEYFARPDSSSSSFERPSSGASRERDQISAPSSIEDHSFPTVPSTSAMLSTHRQSSASELPPRRELPFARATPPKSAGSDTARPVSRASSGSSGRPQSRSAGSDNARPKSRPLSGTMGPPPLPSISQMARRTSSFEQSSAMEVDPPNLRQTSIRRTTSFGDFSQTGDDHLSLTPAARRRTPSFGQAMELDPPSFMQATRTETATEQTPMMMNSTSRPPTRHSSRGSNEDLDLPPLPQPSFFDSNDLPPLPQPTFVENTEKFGRTNSSPAAYDMPNSNNQTAPQLLRTMSSASQNMLPLPSLRQQSASSPSPRPDSAGAAHQGRVIHEIENAARTDSARGLASFAVKTDDERTAFLNDFFAENLENDNFITLCESVSNCWARIGLGME